MCHLASRENSGGEAAPGDPPSWRSREPKVEILTPTPGTSGTSTQPSPAEAEEPPTKKRRVTRSRRTSSIVASRRHPEEMPRTRQDMAYSGAVTVFADILRRFSEDRQIEIVAKTFTWMYSELARDKQ